MSDNYRDGCSGRRFGIGWWLASVMMATAWLCDLVGKGRG